MVTVPNNCKIYVQACLQAWGPLDNLLDCAFTLINKSRHWPCGINQKANLNSCEVWRFVDVAAFKAVVCWLGRGRMPGWWAAVEGFLDLVVTVGANEVAEVELLLADGRFKIKYFPIDLAQHHVVLFVNMRIIPCRRVLGPDLELPWQALTRPLAADEMVMSPALGLAAAVASRRLWGVAGHENKILPFFSNYNLLVLLFSRVLQVLLVAVLGFVFSLVPMQVLA